MTRAGRKQARFHHFNVCLFFLLAFVFRNLCIFQIVLRGVKGKIFEQK